MAPNEFWGPLEDAGSDGADDYAMFGQSGRVRPTTSSFDAEYTVWPI